MQKDHAAGGSSSQRKRLRQTSLDNLFGFNKRQKKDNATNLDKEVEEEVIDLCLEEEMNTSDGSQERRNVLADAAEKRRNATSPVDKPKSPGQHTTATNPTHTPAASTPSTSIKQTSPEVHQKQGTPSTHGVTPVIDRTTKPKSVFDYLEGISSIECNIGASPSSATRRSPTNDDKPSTSTGDVAEGSRSKVKVIPGRGANDDVNRTGGAGSEIADVDSSQGEFSETLEYDASQPLFTDSPSEHSSQEIPSDAPRSLEGQQSYGKGTLISDLNQAPACRAPLPDLKPSQNHTVLFRPHVRAGDPPRPFPDQYQDKWDAYHVRMPCSPENLYPVEDKEGQKRVQSRWEIIETTLLNNIQNSYELEDAILTYNARYSKKWDFRAMHHFFNDVLDKVECEYFFSVVLPGMVQLALQLPKLCTKAIPLLRRQQNHSISLTQQQTASLLANAFFCTYPRRNAQQRRSEYSTFPDINFNRLFEGVSPRKVAKLKCIVNYFRRIVEDTPTGTLTFTRCALTNLPRWDKSTTTLTKCHVTASGMIEDEGAGMLQMDFANKFLGGGVLGHGCVQEEIRFLICPELLLSRLFTEVLDDNECLIMKGAERFSYYSGYANTFKWTGNFQDTIPRDKWGRKETEIVALDALVFHSYANQFKPELIRRELNKAFCGFHSNGTSPQHIPAVATGNWGCGAFGGDTRLKGLLQMMAAAESQRQVCYFTFGDKALCDDLSNMHQFLTSSGVTIGDLWNTLQKYRLDASKSKKVPRLFPYIYQLYSDYQSSTEDEADTGATTGGDICSPYV